MIVLVPHRRILKPRLSIPRLNFRRLGDPSFNRLGIQGQPWGLGKAAAAAEQSYSDKVLGYSPGIYYYFDEGSGVNCVDYSGNSRDGTYNGSGVTYGQIGIGDGKTSVLLDGSNGYIDTPNTSAYADNDEYSWIIWVKVLDWATNFRRFMDFWTGANDLGAVGVYSTDGFVYCSRDSGPYAENSYDMSSDAGWNCYGVTQSQSEGRLDLYVNGSQVDTASGGNVTGGSASRVTIGSTAGHANHINAYVQHGAIWWGAANVLSDADHADLGAL